jgi:hypothetical protein
MAGKSGIRSRSARRFSLEHLGHMHCAAGRKNTGSGRTKPTTETKTEYFMHIFIHLAKGRA